MERRNQAAFVVYEGGRNSDVQEKTRNAAAVLQELALMLPAGDVLRHPAQLLGEALAVRLPQSLRQQASP